jgi:hypothetical protein
LPKPTQSICFGTARIVLFWFKDIDADWILEKFAERSSRKIKHVAAAHLEQLFDDLLPVGCWLTVPVTFAIRQAFGIIKRLGASCAVWEVELANAAPRRQDKMTLLGCPQICLLLDVVSLPSRR